MPFTEKIVEFINTSVKASSLNKKSLQPSSFSGLASIVARKNDAGQLELMPGVLDKKGNYRAITPDDKFNLIVYHKILSNDYSWKVQSYGNKYDHQCTSQMIMVATSNGIRSGITADQLESLMIFGLPQRLPSDDVKALGIIKCVITPVSSNMDRLACWRQEFQNVELKLKPNDAFIIIRYKIETVFGQDCIDLCCS